MKTTIRMAGALCAAATLAFASPALAQCQFAKLGELSVDSSRGTPLVEIQANGKTGKLRIDTGAFASFLSPAGAEAMGLPRVGAPSALRVVGSKGEVSVTHHRLDNVVLGKTFIVPRFGMLVMPGTESSNPEIVGSLGLDVLAASDIEFDLANGRIAIFTPKGCEKASLAYWSDNYSQTATRRPSPERPYITTTVEVNGRSIPAQVRTSWAVSALEKTAAHSAGLRPDSPGVEAISGFGANEEAWVGTFESFAMGEERIKNAKLVFADLFGSLRITETGSNMRQKVEGLPSMILGLDFLRAHRVLVANSQGRMYFSYNGGPVFARPQAAPTAASR